MKAYHWIFLLGSLFQPLSHAAPGVPDTGFGTDGAVSIDMDFMGTSSADNARDVVVQADGKIVVVGHTKPSTYRVFAAARLNADGSPDTTFSGDGKVTTSMAGGDALCQAVVVQPDGKILLAGSYDPEGGTTPDVAMVRYNADGSLDAGFGTGGISITPIRSLTDTAMDVTVQADGKIVIAGYSSNSVTGADAMLARFTANGTLDTTFAGTGYVTRNYLTGYDEYRGVLVRADGAMTAVGNAVGTWIVSRHHPVTGALDTTFSSDGRLDRPTGGSADLAASITLQGDGKLVVAGYDGSSDIVLARYDDAGAKDTTFGVNGRVVTDLGGNEAASQVFAMEDGSLIVATVKGLLRYFSDGTRDLTWGTSGFAAFTIPSTSRVATQADGKIVTVGVKTGSTASANFEVARFTGPGPAAAPDISVKTQGGPDLENGATVNYGMAFVNGGFAVRFDIRNDGNADLTGLSASVTGADAADFSIEEQPSSSIVPGGDTGFLLSYRPVAIGAKTVTLRITSNDPDEAVFQIPITATAEGRGEIKCETKEGTPLPYGADLPMGETVVGQTGGRTIIIRNTGSHPLTAWGNLDGPLLSFAAGSEMFEVAPATIPPIAPGGMVEVTLRFRPTTVAGFSTSFFISSNDAEPEIFVLGLTGSGITAEEGLDNALESSGLVGEDAEPGATPFDDGVENLLKYAFNMNLSGPDASTLAAGTGNSGLPAIGLSGAGEDARIRVEFIRRKGSGLAYIPMRSDSLAPGSFVPMTAAQSVSTIDGDWERVVVEEPAGTSELPVSFAYVKVELP